MPSIESQPVTSHSGSSANGSAGGEGGASGGGGGGQVALAAGAPKPSDGTRQCQASPWHAHESAKVAPAPRGARRRGWQMLTSAGFAGWSHGAAWTLKGERESDPRE